MMKKREGWLIGKQVLLKSCFEWITFIFLFLFVCLFHLFISLRRIEFYLWWFLFLFTYLVFTMRRIANPPKAWIYTASAFIHSFLLLIFFIIIIIMLAFSVVCFLIELLPFEERPLPPYQPSSCAHFLHPLLSRIYFQIEKEANNSDGWSDEGERESLRDHSKTVHWEKKS